MKTKGATTEGQIREPESPTAPEGPERAARLLFECRVLLDFKKRGFAWPEGRRRRKGGDAVRQRGCDTATGR